MNGIGLLSQNGRYGVEARILKSSDMDGNLHGSSWLRITIGGSLVFGFTAHGSSLQLYSPLALFTYGWRSGTDG